jgi:hypothetical protein
VQQHLQRQSGVQKVEVSLRDGTVEITPKDDGSIDPAGLLKATYDSGVSVVEMDFTAEGHVLKLLSGELSLQVEPNRSFEIVPSDLSRPLDSVAGSATTVTIHGELYKKPAGNKKPSGTPGPLKISILEVQK